MGLYYYRARYYSTQLGRFLREDPILTPVFPFDIGMCGGISMLQWRLPRMIIPTGANLSQDLNPYPYVRNNPVNIADPSGLAPGAEEMIPNCSSQAVKCVDAIYNKSDKKCMQAIIDFVNLCQGGGSGGMLFPLMSRFSCRLLAYEYAKQSICSSFNPASESACEQGPQSKGSENNNYISCIYKP
jgi:hypothetical protein